MPESDTVPVVRHRSVSLIVAVLLLAVAGCDKSRTVLEVEDECVRQLCVTWDPPGRVPADSIVILQRDTTITLGDSLLVRVNVYPDTATIILSPEPLMSTYVSWMGTEGTNTHVFKVTPIEARVIWLRASDTFAKGDTMELFVTRPAP